MISARASLVKNALLSRFIDDTISPAVGKSVGAAASLIQITAQGLCPVDTGALRDSITTSVDQVAFESVTATVGPHMFYADYVEYGTGQRGDPAAPYAHVETWPGMTPRPYMRPALDESRGAIADLFREQIEAAING